MKLAQNARFRVGRLGRRGVFGKRNALCVTQPPLQECIMLKPLRRCLKFVDEQNGCLVGVSPKRKELRFYRDIEIATRLTMGMGGT